jgi:hypothetical protein
MIGHKDGLLSWFDPSGGRMRSLVIALIALAATLNLGTEGRAAPDECSIRDSALCLANKNCHWDGSKPGCYPGPAPYIDPCSAHEGEAICNSDGTLGCKWIAATNKCESKRD